jgi:hypothetical protein
LPPVFVFITAGRVCQPSTETLVAPQGAKNYRLLGYFDFVKKFVLFKKIDI